MPENRAAWMTGPKVKPLEVKSAPYTKPQNDEIVIRNCAIAINPVDWVMQDQGTAMVFPWIKYPFIPGTDVAGEVVEIGPRVNRLKVGDRVVGNALGQDKQRHRAAEGAFQEYVTLWEQMTATIPDEMSYEQACVLPLGLSTAACGLFQEDQLGLQLPSMAAKPTGKTLIIWGGSTSVGSNAIQLAAAAGYEVLTTSSPRNFDYCKRLGAAKVFDYNSPSVVRDIVRCLDGKTVAGALSIGSGAADKCFDVLGKCKGTKFVSMASYPLPEPFPERFALPQVIWAYMSWSIAAFIKSKLRGIGYKFIFGTTLIHNGVGKAVYADFLSEALRGGKYIAAPEPLIAGKGLGAIQTAMDLQRKGVSAKKVVVSL